MSGILYGVGLGPGDPELITLKAARLIAAADVIAYPTLDGAESFARQIAVGLLPEGVPEIRIDLPMTTERAPAQAAYDTGAAEIAAALEAGKTVGSFMYLVARVSGDHRVEVIPGVTSVTACAARARVPLAARNERVTILPGPLPEDELRARIEGADTAVLMKVGRHLGKIRRIFESLGLVDQAMYVERATLPEERVMPLRDAPEKAPYFSMILLAKGADPWL
jgi:precorrin-2/cobalt-factor-2 C20-methyltransferase